MHFLFALSNVSALVAAAIRAPKLITQFLDTSTNSFAGVTRDGEGGNVVNGKNVIVFSDPATTKDGKQLGPHPIQLSL